MMEMDYTRPETSQAQPLVLEPEGDTKARARQIAEEKTRGADGKFAKQVSKEDAEAADDAWFERAKSSLQQTVLPDTKKEQAPEPVAAPEQVSESETPSVDKEALAAAMLNAKRLKIPAKALDAMSPTEIVQAGQDWKAQIAENGKLSQKFGELEKKIEAMSSGKVEASAKADQPSEDFDTLVQPFVADYDESTRKSLTGIAKVIHTQAKAESSALKSELAEVKAALGKLQSSSGMAVAETIRNELKGKVPQLGKAEVWNAVLARADMLVKAPEYQANPRQAIEHAIRIECEPTPAAEQVSESTRGKRNGVASTHTQAPRAKVASSDDLDRAAYFGRSG
jgi:hypothetical protein